MGLLSAAAKSFFALFQPRPKQTADKASATLSMSQEQEPPASDPVASQAHSAHDPGGSPDPEQLRDPEACPSANGNTPGRSHEPTPVPPPVLLHPLEELNRRVSEINHAMTSLRDYAAEQSRRYDDLSSGREWLAVKSLCLGIIRVRDHLSRDNPTSRAVPREYLEEIDDRLALLLEGVDVHEFSPPEHSPYRDHTRLAEGAIEATSDPSRDGLIATVTRPGYVHHKTDGDTELVRPAKVTVYKLVPSQSDPNTEAVA